MLQEDGGFPWTDIHLDVNLIKHADGAPILQAEALKVRKVVKTSTALVKKEFTFGGKMRLLKNYAQALPSQYEVPFVDTLLKDIVEDTMSSCILPAQSCATNIRHVRFATFLLKNKLLLPMLKRLRKEVGTGNDLGYSIWTALCTMRSCKKT